MRQKSFTKSINGKLLVLLEILSPLIPDRLFLYIKYYLRMGKSLHLKKPQTYNEKIQWLKLYGRSEIESMLCDKYAVKQFISEKIGEKYIIPLIGAWQNPDDIDFGQLPDRFVLKCTHNSGLGMCICKDKRLLDEKKVREELRKGINQDFYLPSRDKCYKGILHRIIAEEYKVDSITGELRDYKFFCFDGEPKLLFIASGRDKGEHAVTFDFFDMNYNHLPFTNGHPNAKVTPEKPLCFEEMKDLAAVLSQGFPHVRVDFYEADGQVYFGEFTFSHWAGMMPFEPEEWDYKLGQLIDLPNRI